MDPKESAFVVSEVQEPDHIRSCMGEPNLSLPLEDGDPRHGDLGEGLDLLGSAVSPSKQNIHFPAGFSFSFYRRNS